MGGDELYEAQSTSPFQPPPPTGAQQEVFGRNPNANGSDGVPVWRASPFTDQRYIAPGAIEAAGGNGQRPSPFQPPPETPPNPNPTPSPTPPPGRQPFAPPSNPDSGGQAPWRAPYGGVAPIFPGGEQPGPGGPGVERVPDWASTIVPDDIAAAPSLRGGVRFGSRFVPFGPDGQLVDIYATQRGHIENSLPLRTQLLPLYNTGMVTGGLVNGGLWAAERAVAGSPTPPSFGPLRYIYENGQIGRGLATARNANASAQSVLAAAQRDLTLAQQGYTSALEQVQAIARNNPARAAIITELLERTPIGEFDNALATRAGQLSAAEMSTLRSYGQSWTRQTAAAAAQSEAATAAGVARTALTSAEQRLLPQTALGNASGLGNSVLRGAGIGAATVTGLIALDAGMDTLFGRTPDFNGVSPLALEGVALPYILLRPGTSLPMRVAQAGGTMLLSHGGMWAYESLTGRPVNPHGRFSTLGRPSWLEAGLTTTAMLVPLRGGDWRLRAGLVAGAWAVSKIANMTVLYEKDAAAIRDDAQRAFDSAVTATSDRSFRDAVEEAQQLGYANQGALMLMRWDWFRRQSGPDKDHQMVAWRGDAILSAGMGLSAMQQGSRLLDFQDNRQEARFRYFPNTTVDLGGEGLMNLRSAAGTLIMMEQHATQNPNQEVNGRPLGQQVDDIRNMRRFVEEQMDAVYGQQDIRSIVDHIKYRYREGGDMHRLAQFVINLGNRINTAPEHDPRYKAKLCRDLAVVLLGIAEYQSSRNNGEHAAINYWQIERAMREAERLDPQNPNNRPIRDIQRQLATSIDQAVLNQWSSAINNPFGIPGPGGARPR